MSEQLDLNSQHMLHGQEATARGWIHTVIAFILVLTALGVSVYESLL